MLKLEAVYKSFGGAFSRGRTMVADGIDLDFCQGKIIGLVGPSGCGKSTLGRLALGLERPDKGVVTFHGRNIRTLRGKEWRAYRRSAQLVPQHPDAAFNPRLKLRTSLYEAFRFHDICPHDQREEYLKGTLDHVSLNLELLNRYPSQLSGGELQRFAIARAILTKPSVLVLDEVTSMLDVSVQAGIVRTLEALHREHQASYLFISHNLPLALAFCHVIYRLHRGRLEQNTTPPFAN